MQDICLEGVCFMFHCVLMMIGPVFIKLILYDLLLWPSELCPAVSYVHRLQYSDCTATVDPVDRIIGDIL